MIFVMHSKTVMVGWSAGGSEIVGNTEYHIRVIELLLQSDRWDEKLPDCITVPGSFPLLIYARYSKRLCFRLVVSNN